MKEEGYHLTILMSPLPTLNSSSRPKQHQLTRTDPPTWQWPSSILSLCFSFSLERKLNYTKEKRRETREEDGMKGRSLISGSQGENEEMDSGFQHWGAFHLNSMLPCCCCDCCCFAPTRYSLNLFLGLGFWLGLRLVLIPLFVLFVSV